MSIVNSLRIPHETKPPTREVVYFIVYAEITQIVGGEFSRSSGYLSQSEYSSSLLSTRAQAAKFSAPADAQNCLLVGAVKVRAVLHLEAVRIKSVCETIYTEETEVQLP